MKHIIDIETWERRDNYNFFRNFHNSWISITSEVDCTEAFPAAKAAKRSFFLYYLYAVLRAANEVKEFRFRTDKNGQVVYHDQVDIISRGTFSLIMPAFCIAMRSKVLPQRSVWSSATLVITLTTGVITLVESHRPPMPTSITA